MPYDVRMWQGQVVSLHIGREAGAPLEVVPEVKAVAGKGLEGDRYYRGRGYYSTRPSVGGREGTLIETEAVEALDQGLVNAEGEMLGVKITAAETRRNIATSGVPLNHLVGKEFWVGAVRLRGTRLCEPCTYLEGLTGRPRLMSGLLHRGGLRAQILTGGVIRVGDVVRPG